MSIKGLYLFKDFITESEETDLLEYIGEQHWNGSIARKTQHYGFEYNYKSRTAAKPTTPIPKLFQLVIEDVEDKICSLRNSTDRSSKFNQAIVNRYLPNQGIGKHIDSKVFGSVIVSLSLNSDTIMTFRKGDEVKDVLLPRRSVVFLMGASRYSWTHEISKNKTYKHDGKTHKNGTRTSITFRHYPTKT